MVKELSRGLRNFKGCVNRYTNLRGPNWALPFHIHVDASHKAIGEALGQEEEKFPYAIYFIIKNLSKA